MTAEHTVDFEPSDGAALGLLWNQRTLGVVAKVLAESAGPLPPGAAMPGAWMRQTQRHAAALAECATWIRLPARRAGDDPACHRAAFVAGLTLGDAFEIIHGAAELSRGAGAHAARNAYRAMRAPLGPMKGEQCLLSEVVGNPTLIMKL